MPNNDHALGNPQMSDPASQNQSSPSVTSSPSKTSQEGTKGFSRAYLAYVQSITSLRAFASELNPAVQESARKGRSLIEQAGNALAQSCGLSSLDELVDGDRKTIEERIHAAAQKDLRATRTAISVFARVVSRAIRYFPHEQIMRAGLLMSLNGAFEVLLSDILHLFYDYFPGALESEEKNYSLKDLRSFKSMDEFFNHVIENRVDTFLRQSLTDWARFFQQRKIEMTRFAPSWEDFAEYFQRRHVIVHNGGRVSRQYLERVAASWLEQHAEETRLGNVLTVSSDYLDGAFNSFELVGSLLSQECWKRFLPKEREDRDSVLCHHQYECLVEARWNVAETLGSWSISEGDMTSKGALITRINRWLSIKRQGRWSEIESEVLGFDYSILDPRYIAAIHALTGNNDLFFSVLPKAGISEDDLRSWPILEEMRQDPRFEDFIEKAKTETKA